jgi:hypothetical protein
MPKKQKIRMYDLEGNFLEDFDTITLASKKIEVNVSSIISALRYSISLNSWQFRILNEKTPYKIGENYKKAGNVTAKKIGKYYNDKLISVYNSAEEAAKKNNLKKTTVYRAAEKKEYLSGFIFKFLE